jgi:hypothetical protein
MYRYTGNSWSHRSSNKRIQGKFGAVPGKHSNDYVAQVSCSVSKIRNWDKMVFSTHKQLQRRWFCSYISLLFIA